MKMTIAIARAIAQDAGNRSVRKGERIAWNEQDWNAATKAYETALNLYDKRTILKNVSTTVTFG